LKRHEPNDLIGDLADYGRLGFLGDEGEQITFADLHQGTRNNESAQCTLPKLRS
jgi:hypothetical protein